MDRRLTPLNPGGVVTVGPYTILVNVMGSFLFEIPADSAHRRQPHLRVLGQTCPQKYSEKTMTNNIIRVTTGAFACPPTLRVQVWFLP